MTADPAAPRARRRVCPICGKPALESEAPFCSRRCADVDLHRWTAGVYAVPARDMDDQDDVEPGDTSER